MESSDLRPLGTWWSVNLSVCFFADLGVFSGLGLFARNPLIRVVERVRAKTPRPAKTLYEYSIMAVKAAMP